MNIFEICEAPEVAEPAAAAILIFRGQQSKASLRIKTENNRKVCDRQHSAHILNNTIQTNLRQESIHGADI
jgi:hypothetical protein